MTDFSLADLVREFPQAITNLALPREVAAQLAEHLSTDRSRVLSDRAEQMPLLAEIAREIRDKPLANLRVVIVLHFLRDLLYFVSFCEDAGLDPGKTVVFFKRYPYLEKDFVSKCLKDWGYGVSPLESLDEILPSFLVRGNEPLLIVEDGGYVVPFLHKSLESVLPRVVGAVEQTTKGEARDEELKNTYGALSFPVISIAHSRVKADFEPGAVASAVWSNIKRLASSEVWHGKVALVVGYGTIGRALARHLRDELAVVIYDKTVYQRALARFDGFETVDDLQSAMARPALRLIIGATGNESLSGNQLAVVPGYCYLASASSDRVEIGISFLDQSCTRTERRPGVWEYVRPDGSLLYVLAEGFPVNFYGNDSVQNQVIDLVMTQMFLSAIALSTGSHKLAADIDQAIVNTLTQESDVVDRFYRIHYRPGVSV